MSSMASNSSTDIPLGNNTALNHEIVRRWVYGANTRGTADILYTCIVTIVLCVWTSVHMNIPASGEHATRKWLRKVKWTMIGLFAPEVVLYTAWSQYNEALDLVKYLNEQRERHEKEKTIKGRAPVPFNMRYGFFAVMGGFTAPHSALEETNRLVSITPGTLRALAYAGRFLWIEDQEVQDRSNADSLAKLIICAQVTWLCCECIARKASNLPLTILEIHTFIHVVCALAIYLVWLKKPLDVFEATVVSLSTDDDELLSFLDVMRFVSSDIFYRVQRPVSKASAKTGECFEFSTRYRSAPYVEKADNVDLDATVPCAATYVPGLLESSSSKHFRVSAYTIIGSDEKGIGILVYVQPCTDAALPLHAVCFNRPKIGHKVIQIDFAKSLSLVTRKQAFRAWEKLNPSEADLSTWWLSRDNRVKNFSDSHVLTNKSTLALQSLILMAYGGVHLTAWHSHFPTTTEMWMWRASALLLAGTTPMVFAVVIPIAGLVRRGLATDRLTRGSVTLFVLLGPLIFLAYIGARYFLVVESFVSLRSVPVGVYSAVPWSNYIPHI